MSKRPNFLFIMTDQHRADHLGCAGNKVVQTPAIDAIAGAGTRFDRFYVADPVCMPNRSSILTGRMPSVHGVLHNGKALSHDDTTFVDVLRESGYATALIGKSHLQNFTGMPPVKRWETDDSKIQPPEHLRDAMRNTRSGPDYELENVKSWTSPLMQRWQKPYYGFEHFEVANDHADQAGGDYKLWAREQQADFDSLVGPANAIADDRYNAPQAWRTSVPEELYSTRWIQERTEAHLESLAARGDPFFLKVSFPDPHHPFTPPGRYWDMYNPADMTVPDSFGRCTLPPVLAMQKAMREGTDPRDNQSPFAVTEDETRQIIALTYGMITMIDDAIAAITSKLKALGLDENTIIVFTADHGDYMGDHGIMLKLLLHFQGLIRIPFIWRDPTGKQPATRDDLCSSIDIAPTILARAGIQPYHGIQGRDMFTDPEPDALIVEEDSSRPMTGFDRVNTSSGFKRYQRIRTVVTRDWRMSLRENEDWGELYQINEDPGEITNLYDDPGSRDTRNALTEQMLRRLITLQDHAPLPTSRA